MTPDRHLKLQEIFDEALNLPKTERARYVEQACAGDPGLQHRLNELLGAHEEMALVSTLISASGQPAVMECPKCGRCYDSPESVCSSDNTALHVAFPGTRLIDGKYLVERRLGRGGMGSVYLARDMRLRREVAIKIQQQRFSARFEREARAIASMNHPHICALYDIGPSYLVMEYVEGEKLRGPLPVQDAVKLGLQIVDALEAAHRRNIVHRDLKPANILVTTDRQVKLVDFGIARMVDDRDALPTIEGTVLGTSGYMSPEQAQGKPADSRSDIFSFGITLYELMAGRHPFAGSSQMEAVGAILRDKPKPLMDVPAGVQSAIMRCLKKDPAERFQSMAEVRDALLAGMRRRETQAEPGPSIAVLPFANMSRDPDDEYFSDGLAEEIINALAQVRGLKVIARMSAFAFRGKDQDIRKIAKVLGVNHVLEGSVRRSGNRLRITAQLIQATDGTHLWSQRYDRDMTDIFAIQDEISEAISSALKLNLTHHTKQVNIEAYNYYLQGHYHRVRLRPESLEKAREYFERAIAIEPEYAPAHSGLASYYWMLGAFGMKPVGEMAPRVKAAAEKALAIDPANSEAHSVLAIMAAIFDYDWKAADEHYRDAMAAESVPPLVRFRYSMHFLLPLGRIAEAKYESQVALDTDPLSTLLHWGAAWALFQARDYPESLERAGRAVDIDPHLHLAWLTMGLAQLAAGSNTDALVSLGRVVDLTPWWHLGTGLLAAAYHKMGDTDRAREWVEKLQQRSQERTFGAAFYHSMAGETDAMFNALEGAYEQRDVFLVYLRTIPFFDAHHQDERYKGLLRRMNLANGHFPPSHELHLPVQ